MKYSAVVAAVVGVAAAQSLNDVPQCALKCLTPAIQATGCAQTDIACLCKPSNMQSIVKDGTACVVQSCGQDVAINQVLPAVNKICASAGGSSASGSASGSASAPSSAPASQSSGSISAPAQTSGSASPTKSASSTVAPTASSGSSSSSSSRAATTSAPQSSAPTNGTQTTRPSTAAAAAATGFGSFAMLALGALAAF